MASGRMQRWSLMLQCYKFNLIHRSDKKLGMADLLSRLPLPQHSECVPIPVEWVNFINSFDGTPISSCEIKKFSMQDEDLSKIEGYCKMVFR